MDWSSALHLLSATACNDMAARTSFTFLQNVVYEAAAGGLTVESFASVINVLNAFATVAGQKIVPSEPSLR